MTGAHHSGCPHVRGGSRPAVVVTDLDRTLLRSDATLSERSAAALYTAAAHGVRVVFATARPAWSARKVLSCLPGLSAYLVSSNGAVVSELDSGRVRRIRTMTPATVRAEIASLGQPVWAVDREHDRLLGPGWPDILASDSVTASRVTALPDGSPVLCLMVHTDSDGPPAPLGARGAVRWTSSSPELLEVSALEADKVSAVAWVLADAGVAWERVVAFGDAPNDAELLATAGLGVAVANAVPNVLEVADAVTGPNDGDGVATWLEEMCLCHA
ncbi:HAD family hydrolase [Streptantibioticus rubrisoli]|uniref:HAD hydrolase family protein n=1 Tax=Streptantibioticus rubrisoli TaxID=1387313 RepID=A0ABT1PLG1_9ACTN|nr:HAD hydrolase family protein [Streptantibioticus rubrisoli]MCQ4045135.1 HAD hydrolase family protein [Streptantibioticus rubrisoli]